MRNGHTGDLRTKLKIASQVSRALAYVHTQKIIHRDLKPENIHINAAGVVKLIDFGIAKTEGLQMTRAGYVLGTPFYMAPEQVTGEQITEQVDVYAFGVLLFELLTGRRLKLTAIQASQGTDSYSGLGGTQTDGRMLLELTSGKRVVRVALAK